LCTKDTGIKLNEKWRTIEENKWGENEERMTQGKKDGNKTED
jgi:hypothetical protein